MLRGSREEEADLALLFRLVRCFLLPILLSFLADIVLSNSHFDRNWMHGRRKHRPWHRFPLNMATMLPDSIRCGVQRAIQQPDKTVKEYP
jgi:hypothetical protein